MLAILAQIHGYDAAIRAALEWPAPAARAEKPQERGGEGA